MTIQFLTLNRRLLAAGCDVITAAAEGSARFLSLHQTAVPVTEAAILSRSPDRRIAGPINCVRLPLYRLAAGLLAGLVLSVAACGNPDVPAGRSASPEETPVQETGAAVPQAAYQKAAGLWGVKPGEPVRLSWEDLMPEGGQEALEEELAAYFRMLEERYNGDVFGALARIEEGSQADYMPQLGSFETVPDLDGLFVRIPGYAVPIEAGSGQRHRSFLLVPYAGACIHSPPPPPNQIVHIEAASGVQLGGLEVAYWAEGLLRAETQETSLAAAAYTLTLTRLEPFRMPPP